MPHANEPMTKPSNEAPSKAATIMSDAASDAVGLQVTTLLRVTLGLGERPLTADTPLLGSLPELDSMAVAGLLLALEEHFGIVVHDDEISARHFATVGTLADFVRGKLP